jgi:hypothetical protein
VLQTQKKAFVPCRSETDGSAELSCQRYEELVMQDKQGKIALFEALKKGGLYYDGECKWFQLQQKECVF